MIQGYGPVTQALLGTLLTWGLTALGSAMVIFLRGNQVNNNCDSIDQRAVRHMHPKELQTISFDVIL